MARATPCALLALADAKAPNPTARRLPAASSRPPFGRLGAALLRAGGRLWLPASSARRASWLACRRALSPQRGRPRATALPRAPFPYFYKGYCRGLQPAPIARGFRYSTPLAHPRSL